MTLPEESNRAVAATREFLVRLSSPYVEGGIKGIRREVRAEALALLRHYPYTWLSQNGDCPDEDNAARPDNTPATHATPRVGSEQCECTLTDAEREAVAWAIGSCEIEQTTASDAADRGYKLPDTREWAAKHGERAATLRGLLERIR